MDTPVSKLDLLISLMLTHPQWWRWSWCSWFTVGSVRNFPGGGQHFTDRVCGCVTNEATLPQWLGYLMSLRLTSLLTTHSTPFQHLDRHFPKCWAPYQDPVLYSCTIPSTPLTNAAKISPWGSWQTALLPEVAITSGVKVEGDINKAHPLHEPLDGKLWECLPKGFTAYQQGS